MTWSHDMTAISSHQFLPRILGHVLEAEMPFILLHIHLSCHLEVAHQKEMI